MRRIIPARAGFTPGRRAWVTRLRDHPRSRGVYIDGVDDRLLKVGSSPLARGLPVSLMREPSRRADHPRSRGVYRPRH